MCESWNRGCGWWSRARDAAPNQLRGSGGCLGGAYRGSSHRCRRLSPGRPNWPIYSPLSYTYSGSLAAVASTTCWPQLSLGPKAPRYTVYALYALCEGATEPLSRACATVEGGPRRPTHHTAALGLYQGSPCWLKGQWTLCWVHKVSRLASPWSPPPS